jgi:ribonuclease P protein subunit POP4
LRISPEVVQHGFIGLKARVAKSSNPSCLGVTGTIIDETRNTFVMMCRSGRKTVAKSHSVFRFSLPDTTVVEVEGTALLGRPEERLKRRVRRIW